MLVLLVQLLRVFQSFFLLFLQEKIDIEHLLGLFDVLAGLAEFGSHQSHLLLEFGLALFVGLFFQLSALLLGLLFLQLALVVFFLLQALFALLLQAVLLLGF